LQQSWKPQPFNTLDILKIADFNSRQLFLELLGFFFQVGLAMSSPQKRAVNLVPHASDGAV
jgi:hypothetical protein